MKSFTALLFLVLLALSGCNQPEPVSKNTPPSWIMNPNQSGKIGAVGSANRVYSGKASDKRKLAISRALDELSLQQGVKVEMSMTKVDKLSNNRSSVNMEANSNYSTSKTISAHIEDMWESPTSKELFIWMVLD